MGSTGVHGEGGAVQSWVGPPGSVPDLPMPRRAGASPGQGRLDCLWVDAGLGLAGNSLQRLSGSEASAWRACRAAGSRHHCALSGAAGPWPCCQDQEGAPSAREEARGAAAAVEVSDQVEHLFVRS